MARDCFPAASSRLLVGPRVPARVREFDRITEDMLQKVPSNKGFFKVEARVW